MAHTVRCAHDDCSELSTRVSFKPTPREEEAAAHRRALAADGWSDVEGRDYCPDHIPSSPAA